MANKKKINELIQTDGKKETFIATTLQQILGDNGFSKYGHLELDKYISQLKEYNLADLRKHAIKIGIVPSMNRDRIERQLLIEFKKYVTMYQKPQSNIPHLRDIPMDKLEAARKVMNGVK